MKQYTWTVAVEADSGTDENFSDLTGLEDTPDLEVLAPDQTEKIPGGEIVPANEEQKGTETHRVVYTFSRLRGCITVSIDGDAFDLPAGFLGLHAVRREIFRLGAEQAVLAVDRKGHASLILRGNTLPPEAP